MTSGLLALTIALQTPKRVAKRTVYGHARWCIVSGLAFLSIHFLVQYLFGFREMGITQGVFINLLFFMPAVAVISMGLLYVQRRGDLAPREWYITWSFVFAAAAILTVTALCDGVPFREESHALRNAERVSAVLYQLMQVYIFLRLGKEYLAMKRTVSAYYDKSQNHLFRWLGVSVFLMMILGLVAGLREFGNGFRRVAVPPAFEYLLGHAGLEALVQDFFVLRRGEGKPAENKRDGANHKTENFDPEVCPRRRKLADCKTEDDGDEDDARIERDAHSACLLVHDPQEPSDGGEQEHAHHLLERDHPFARFRENLQRAGEGAHQQVGERKPEPCGGKE